jgi:hypothetical protein
MMKKMAPNISVISPAYRQFVKELKSRVAAARLSAARAVNRDVILRYWDIGQAIVEKTENSRMGGVCDRSCFD